MLHVTVYNMWLNVRVYVTSYVSV